jgi:hypothetical protein
MSLAVSFCTRSDFKTPVYRSPYFLFSLLVYCSFNCLVLLSHLWTDATSWARFVQLFIDYYQVSSGHPVRVLQSHYCRLARVRTPRAVWSHAPRGGRDTLRL